MKSTNTTPAAESPPSLIVSLTAENVKRLRAVRVTPTGAIVKVGGRNAQGKTSLLDCITYALTGGKSLPAEPVRRGEKHGSIILETQDLIVKRRFTAGGGTTLEVTNKDGLKYSSPQGVLDKLTATLAFDPLSFCRADKKEKFRQLQALLGIDTAALDRRRKEAYDRRTAKNREVADMKGVVNSLPIAGPARVEVSALLDELQAAEKANAAVTELEREVMECEGQLQNRENLLSQAISEVRRLEELLEKAKEDVERWDLAVDAAKNLYLTAQERAAAAVLVDTAPIRERIKSSEAVNAEAARAELRKEKVAALSVLEDEAAMMTADIEAIDKERAAMLANCPMPVPGIGFEADGVTLNGLPLEQASAAESLKLGVAVACAMNPKMRVMLVRDGSLLDDDSMAMLAEMAEAHGAQIWVERVGNDGKCTVVIEDGEAVAEALTEITDKPFEQAPQPPWAAEQVKEWEQKHGRPIGDSAMAFKIPDSPPPAAVAKMLEPDAAIPAAPAAPAAEPECDY